MGSGITGLVSANEEGAALSRTTSADNAQEEPNERRPVKMHVSLLGGLRMTTATAASCTKSILIPKGHSRADQ